MLHDRFDLDFWVSKFPLSHLRDENGKISRYADINTIAGPSFVALVEQYRALAYNNLPNIKRVPTDIFVWSRGESTQRAVTKTGGLPYWERTKPWPTASSGNPLTFVAQICFIDSYDIVSHLPGEILLIFSEARSYQYKGEIYYNVIGEEENDTFLLFEWVDRTTRPLVWYEDIPFTGLKILPCYGNIYRTWDYPGIDGFAYSEIAEYIPPIWEATKIGGICPQSELIPKNIGGNYICTQKSVEASPFSFPFLNVPEKISYEEWKQNPVLTFGDVGFINLFFSQDGKVHWTLHCN